MIKTDCFPFSFFTKIVTGKAFFSGFKLPGLPVFPQTFLAAEMVNFSFNFALKRFFKRKVHLAIRVLNHFLINLSRARTGPKIALFFRRWKKNYLDEVEEDKKEGEKKNKTKHQIFLPFVLQPLRF